jgi:hypothetical protein
MKELPIDISKYAVLRRYVKGKSMLSATMLANAIGVKVEEVNPYILRLLIDNYCESHIMVYDHDLEYPVDYDEDLHNLDDIDEDETSLWVSWIGREVEKL